MKTRACFALLVRLPIIGLSVLGLAKAAEPGKAMPSEESKDQPPTAAMVPGPAGQAGADTNLAERKIQALGLRDDTLSYEQQPYNWLWDRREQLVALLVAGLESANLESARQCLRLLDGIKPTPALADALFKVASDPKHPVRADATLSLCRFAGDPRVMKLLESSWTNAAIFPDAGDRATLAEATGHRPEAAELLGSLFAAKQEKWDLRKIIGRLVSNATPAALAILSKAANDKIWHVAAAARLALAEADPAGHALTAGQKEFLQTAGFGFKESSEQHRQRCQKLAAIPPDEIRPLLRHMLTTDRAGDAALFYGLCHEPEALPEIRQRALADEGWQASFFIAAWLLLDESNQPIHELLEKCRTEKNEFRQEVILRAVAEADLPPARQLAFFRGARDQLNMPVAVVRAIARNDQPVVLATLFEEETNFAALGEYAAWVGRSPKAEFEKPLRRAVERVANASPSALQSSANAPYAILEAAAAYPLKDLDDPARRLMDSPEPQIAIAAARLASGGTHRKTALTLLNDKLGNPQSDARQKAAGNLLKIPCLNEEERRQREQAVLELLGQPAEDYALRVLITCAGPQTITKLEPRLDGTDLPAARYAAWVLAQSSNPEIASMALRRLALHALFCHQVYQQGEGIDFGIAPDLSFHQSTGGFLLEATTTNANAGLQIPADLMMPTRLDAAEQTFLVRDYREVSTSTVQYVLGDYFMMFDNHFGQPPDATYLPFFEVAAREDPTLQCLHVQGRKVAHFKYRQAAAQSVARLTGKPATYPGLTGEALAADQVPSQPYPDQDQLIARLLLDRIQAANLKERPASDQDWSRVGYFNDLMQHLTDEEKFGAGLRDAILLEAGRREMGPALKNAGFGLWR